MLNRLLAAATEWTGLGRLIRQRVGRRNVTVLLYHDPAPSVFAEHISFLRQHYNLIPYGDVLSALAEGRWEDLPDYSLVIHIDDGYKRNAELLDTLKSNDVRPTLFVCSHIVGTHRRFWSKLNGGDSKKLRHVSNPVLLRKLKDEANFTPESEFHDRQALSEQELQQLSEVIDVESHGRFHFSAPTLPEPDLRRELDDSRARASELSGQHCNHFSAPYGDYSKREIDAVKQAGYQSLRTTRPGWITKSTDSFEIPITADVEDEASISALRFHLTGIPRRLKRTIYVVVTQHLYALRQRLLVSKPFFADISRDLAGQ